MAVAQPQPMSVVQRRSSPSGLAEVLDVILDKGIVIDVFVRVALVGIESESLQSRRRPRTGDHGVLCVPARRRAGRTLARSSFRRALRWRRANRTGAGPTADPGSSTRAPRPPARWGWDWAVPAGSPRSGAGCRASGSGRAGRTRSPKWGPTARAWPDPRTWMVAPWCRLRNCLRLRRGCPHTGCGDA